MDGKRDVTGEVDCWNTLLEERVVIESFDLPAIECVKRIDARLRTAALFGPSFATPPLLASRQIVEAARAVGADEVALHRRLATATNIRAALDARFEVVCWTIDKPEWIERAKQLGVKALITNDPALMLRQYRERQRPDGP